MVLLDIFVNSFGSFIIQPAEEHSMWLPVKPKWLKSNINVNCLFIRIYHSVE